MRSRDLLGLAWGQIRRGGLRSGLCAGMVAVGVCAVLLIGAVGQCAQREMHTAIGSLGLRGMTCYLSDPETGDALTPAFADQITQALPEVRAAMPVKYRTGMYQTGHQSGSTLLFGVDARMDTVLQVTVRAGRLLTAAECAQPVRRAVISERLAQTVFGRVEVAGQTIRLTVDGAQDRYEIVGVIADQTRLLTGLAGSAVPEIVYLPYALLAQRSPQADQILLSCAGDPDQLARSLNRLAGGMLGVRGTLGVQDLSGYLSEIDRLAAQAVQVFLLVAGVSLLVALGAVMSGMLSAAHEMREQIGIYRAIGGRQRDIFWIFLVQAGLTCLLGAFAGVAGAAGIAAAAQHVTGYALTLPVGLTGIVLALAVGCGAAAGLLPALRAARLDPVQTMRR